MLSDNFVSISAEQAKNIIDEQGNCLLLDVRTQEEYEDGHIKGAVFLPLEELEKRAKEIIPGKSDPLLIYCHSGRRSKLAAQLLAHLGYETIYEIGGIIDWPYEIVKE